MRLWTVDSAPGRYMGVCGVALASTVEEAAHLLNEALQARGKEPTVTVAHLQPLPQTQAAARILFDGDY